MTTESDAVLATIVDNWGNGGYGGATPAIQSTADIMVDRWAALDAVIILHDTLDEHHKQVNDTFADKTYNMVIRVTSITSEDQLKLLVEETEYLLNNTAITGFTSARITQKDRSSSDRKRKVYRNDMTVELKATLSSSAIAPDGGSGTNMNQLLMFGSANATWVPMTYEANYSSAVLFRGESSQITNTGATDGYWMFNLPLPTVKGSLKLYINGFRLVITDADDADYVTQVYLTGAAATNNVILNDGTDRKIADTYDYTFTAEDMSAEHTVRAVVQTVNTNAAGLNLATVSCRCYYAA